MAQRSRLWFDIALLTVLAGAVFGSAVALTRKSDYQFFDPILDARTIITRHFRDVPDEKKLQDGAIKGMMEALDDPYTVYVPASEKRGFEKDLTGQYVGIGASVNVVDGWLTIVSPLEDSPAYKSGILPDDRVVEINGTSTHNKTVDDCIALLLGEPNTKVMLGIERKGEKLTLEITRAHIKSRSLKGYHRDPADPEQWKFLIDPARKIAYFRLTQFTPQCSDEIARALESLHAEKGELKGLVLDLRYNPGGLLDEAIEIADMFLKDGVIVSTKYRGATDQIAKARAEGTLPDFPIAVLLNGSAASASEVLSGALVENNRAIVVGTRSYGKGSVQSVYPLEHGGGEIKITQGGYYLPSGRSLHRKDDSKVWGVDPTKGFYAPVTDDEELDMLKARRDLDVIRKDAKPVDGDWNKTDWVLGQLKDKQLTVAVEALQARIDSGAWKPASSESDDAVANGELGKARQYEERLTKELIRAQRRVETLEAGKPEARKTKDLWADNVEVKGGKIDIYDKSGKLIGSYKITGNDLERWLIEADVASPEKVDSKEAPKDETKKDEPRKEESPSK